jgi:hypothetical protein
MKIISGGQTGADQGGLGAALDSGFETGGWAPKTFRTLGGSDPELGTKYGLVEHHKFEYPPRTQMNAKNSDATIGLAFNFKSPGMKCTATALRKADKPYLKIDLADPLNPIICAKWLKENRYETVNIAGNGDGPANGEVYVLTYNYLMSVFKEYKKL